MQTLLEKGNGSICIYLHKNEKSLDIVLCPFETKSVVTNLFCPIQEATRRMTTKTVPEVKEWLVGIIMSTEE